jgi:hypothetical protein
VWNSVELVLCWCVLTICISGSSVCSTYSSYYYYYIIIISRHRFSFFCGLLLLSQWRTPLLYYYYYYYYYYNSVRLFWKLLAYVSLLGTSETFLCSTFALQLKTVLLLDVLQLLMLSAGTLIYLQDKMFHWNTFYCKQDTAYMLSIYLIICVQNFILLLLLFFVLLFYVL